MVGDTVGLVDVPSLKGIHYAMQSGIYAARATFEALKRGDTSGGGALPPTTGCSTTATSMNDLYRTRNMRLAFKDGLFLGGLKAGLMTVTRRRASPAAGSRCRRTPRRRGRRAGPRRSCPTTP